MTLHNGTLYRGIMPQSNAHIYSTLSEVTMHNISLAVVLKTGKFSQQSMISIATQTQYICSS